MAGKVKPIPDAYRGVIPYISVNDAAAAMEFYKRAFDAVEMVRMPGPNGKIGHAELKIGDFVLMLADEFPEMEFRAPTTLGGSPVGLMFYVEDVDAVVAKAKAAGATVTREVADQFYGDRMGCLKDSFGHSWYIATHVEDIDAAELKKRGQAAAEAMEKGEKK